MTQMALPYAYPSTRRAAAADTSPARWRLFSAEFATAVVVNLGSDSTPPPYRSTDRGVMMTAAPAGAVLVGPETRLVAVQPSVTSW
ncbi:hypothetical protein [Actinoplanes couchii]|uniref:Uncharacterized protein n=1 Tax=Actinoplanes couchii TaxID=403638 RepID=A0ABQ3XTW8_9ACTN|nr:hypothetical protein [Actinoplanes couchii]MDR6317771.1 hypothetical protein [Actinoplanes couchii]GID61939.1 hypothetical protein Aco03nite_103430 [Actinoplanes couchii]